jgi:hypothetical protein
MMTKPAAAFRIARTSQVLAIRSPVPLPLLSHVLDHSVGGPRANGTHYGPSVSRHYSAPFGYYENSGTLRLVSCRPSHVPLRRNVRARRRCPIHVLQCVRYASPIAQGVPRAKVEPVARDGVGLLDVLPTSVPLHRWTLGFGQSCSHPIAQALQDYALHVFGHPPLSRHAVVPYPFGVR